MPEICKNSFVDYKALQNKLQKAKLFKATVSFR